MSITGLAYALLFLPLNEGKERRVLTEKLAELPPASSREFVSKLFTEVQPQISLPYSIFQRVIFKPNNTSSRLLRADSVSRLLAAGERWVAAVGKLKGQSVILRLQEESWEPIVIPEAVELYGLLEADRELWVVGSSFRGEGLLAVARPDGPRVTTFPEVAYFAHGCALESESFVLAGANKADNLEFYHVKGRSLKTLELDPEFIKAVNVNDIKGGSVDDLICISPKEALAIFTVPGLASLVLRVTPDGVHVAADLRNFVPTRFIRVHSPQAILIAGHTGNRGAIALLKNGSPSLAVELETLLDTQSVGGGAVGADGLITVFAKDLDDASVIIQGKPGRWGTPWKSGAQEVHDLIIRPSDSRLLAALAFHASSSTLIMSGTGANLSYEFNQHRELGRAYEEGLIGFVGTEVRFGILFPVIVALILIIQWLTYPAIGPVLVNSIGLGGVSLFTAGLIKAALPEPSAPEALPTVKPVAEVLPAATPPEWEVLLRSQVEEMRNAMQRTLSRANTLLAVGVALSLVGIFVFYLTLEDQIAISSRTSLAIAAEKTVFVRSIGLLVFIEVLALFFLRQYRSALDDYKYFLDLSIQKSELLAAWLLISRDGVQKATKDALSRFITVLTERKPHLAVAESPSPAGSPTADVLQAILAPAKEK
ncbi:hypothetical protein ACN28E_31530 [Archangium lansingense]|uniref:hypothetical protein n=1 Tax=Archangium lansingense TaxID=2995310 RepID=UPI003B80D29D